VNRSVMPKVWRARNTARDRKKTFQLFWVITVSWAQVWGFKRNNPLLKTIEKQQRAKGKPCEAKRLWYLHYK
jgi:hypothetical protein